MSHKIDYQAISKRLNRIEGQIRGIHKMVETGQECEDILLQISAAKSALHKTGEIILEQHLHHCVVDGIKSGNEAETLQKLSSAIERFSRIL